MARFLFRFHFNIFGIVHLLKRPFTYRYESVANTVLSRRFTAHSRTPADIFNKAQIVHAIGFVQYHHLNGTEVHVVLLGVVN